MIPCTSFFPGHSPVMPLPGPNGRGEFIFIKPTQHEAATRGGHRSFPLLPPRQLQQRDCMLRLRHMCSLKKNMLLIFACLGLQHGRGRPGQEHGRVVGGRHPHRQTLLPRQLGLQDLSSRNLCLGLRLRPRPTWWELARWVHLAQKSLKIISLPEFLDFNFLGRPFEWPFSSFQQIHTVWSCDCPTARVSANLFAAKAEQTLLENRYIEGT